MIDAGSSSIRSWIISGAKMKSPKSYKKMKYAPGNEKMRGPVESYVKEIRKIVPGATARDMELYDGGWENTIITYSDSIVFRFPHMRVEYEELLKTQMISRILSRKITFEVPYIHVAKCSSDLCSYFTYYRKIPGINISNSDINEGNIENISRSFSTFLIQMNSIKIDDMKGIRRTAVSGEDLKKNYERMLEEFEMKSLKYTGKDLMDSVRSRFETFLDLDMHSYRPAICHCDISTGNILFRNTGGEISGVIDLDYSGIGDRALDLAGILYYFGPDVFRRVFANFPIQEDGTMLQRIYFYASIAGIYKINHGIEEDPAFIYSGIDDLKRDLKIFSFPP